ncbi:MAG: hypothetical protein AAF943_10355 [Pseudomonadota bacterium]
MPGKKEVLTAVCTLLCAAAIGHVMQSTEEAHLRYGIMPTPAFLTLAGPPEGSVTGRTLLDVTDIALTSSAGGAQAHVSALAHIFDALETRTVGTFPTQPDQDGDCAISVQTTLERAAMVHLEISAPCLPNEKLTVHHNGMMFSEVMSERGTLSLDVPALAEEAVFIVAFPSGEGAMASLPVHTLQNYDRAVLQWPGHTGFELHAREFGAGYGDVGHRWAGQAGDLEAVTKGESGILTRHGNSTLDDPLMAEVYTFPKNVDGRSGEVLLTVEAEVTQENCGLEVEAQSLEMQADGQIRSRTLLLPVPGCDSIGSFLVLNNLLQDLKVALN